MNELTLRENIARDVRPYVERKRLAKKRRRQSAAGKPVEKNR